MSAALTRPLVLLVLLMLPLFFLWWRLAARGYRLPLLLRTVALVLLVLAAAGPRVGTRSDVVNVVFAVDASASTSGEARETALEYVKARSAEAGPEDTVGVLSFASDVGVEAIPSHPPIDVALRTELDASRTNIERAVYRALALFPLEGQNKLVLVSDGNETTGNGLDAARAARGAGVEILTAAVSGPKAQAEVRARDLISEVESRAGEAHELRAIVSSTVSTRATLTIYRDGEYWGEEEVRLVPGDNVFRYTARIESQGLHTYRLRVDAVSDATPQNNEVATTVRVGGPARLIYVYGESGPSSALVSALRAQGVRVEPRAVAEIPGELAGLVRYDAAIFDNVAAYDLSLKNMQNFEDYVRELGRGFVMLGGEDSFGAGGYYRTPIERMLPVDMDVTSSMQIPSLAMVFVIDKSGSMGNAISRGATKLDVVKEAVIPSVGLMNPYYEVGLLAFDADFEWTVPMTRAGEQRRIRENLTGLSTGGGTVLMPALQEAFSRLRRTEAATKHIVLLSDGLTSDEDFEEITGSIRARGITLSTVAVGQSSNRALMAQLAGWGAGRTYYTDAIRNVPRIFAAETNLVSQNLVVEESFVPQPSRHAVLKGLSERRFPIMDGFVLTYPKAGASEVLAAIKGNPLLAVWQYGLGRSAAFTSDVHGRWSEGLLAWDAFPQFMGQLVRWVEPADPDGLLDVGIETQDGAAIITVDALTPQGSFLNDLTVHGRVLARDEERRTVELSQVAPGRYRARIDAASRGSYLITLAGAETDRGESPGAAARRIGPVTYGFHVGYSREYDGSRTDSVFLRKLAADGGGSYLGPVIGPNGGGLRGDTGGAARGGMAAGPRTGDRRGAGESAGSDLFARTGHDDADLRSAAIPILIAALLVLLTDVFLTYVVYPRRAYRTVADREPADRAAGERAPADRSAQPPPGAGGAEALSYREVRSRIVKSYEADQWWIRKRRGWPQSDPENEVASSKIYHLRRRLKRLREGD